MKVAHLTTVDMSLELLLGPQLDAVVAAGGEAIAISAPGPFVDAIELRGARHLALSSSTRGWSLRSDLLAAFALWRLVRRERPTILHTHNPKPGIYGRVVGRLAGVPIVVNTTHGLYATPDDSWPRRLFVYALEAFASRWSHAELVQNVEDVEVIHRWHLAARRKVRHLGNGVDLERFRPGLLADEERRDLRRAWTADDDTVVIGTVGRLVAEKGFGELFDAVATLHPGARLVVVGGHDPDKSDALAPALLEQARDQGVLLLGHRADVARLLGAFDVFVLASHREGQPRAAMEAAATGLPIVATDIRGCRQIVDHEVTGLLVPVADVTALHGALTSLIESPERRRAMGAAAVDKAHREFDEREVVRRVVNCYVELAARRGVSLCWRPSQAEVSG